MKIIQVMPHFGLGGAEIMCENLVYQLEKLGHEVIVVSLYNKETAITKRFAEAGVDLRFLDKKAGFDFSIYKKLRKLFEQEKPDVIHTHIHTTQYVFPIAKKMKIKVVHTVHSVAQNELPKKIRIFNKYFYKKNKATPVALSGNVNKTIQDVYKLKEESIPTVFNGIDLSKCRTKDDYSKKGNFKIVHVGSFQELKNHIGLIDAFEIFHQKNPQSELHIIGDGQRRCVIEELVREKNLQDHVIFYGFQSNVHEFLHEMDVFTLPSFYEGIPMSIIEAMGTALPIVATNVGGIPDMLTNDENAILTNVDSGEIADAFLKLSNDEALRERLGKNAYARSFVFSSEEMAKKYVEIYKGEHRC